MAVYVIDDTTVPDTLNGAINDTTLTITLDDASSYPTGEFVILIDAEEIDIDSRTGNVLTVRTGGRGYGDTTAASHSDAAEVTHIVTNQDWPFRRTVGSTRWEAEGEVYLKSNSRVLSAAASGVILRMNGDGDTDSHRRYEWRRSASFGQLDLYGITSVGTATRALSVTDAGLFYVFEDANFAKELEIQTAGGAVLKLSDTNHASYIQTVEDASDSHIVIEPENVEVARFKAEGVEISVAPSLAAYWVRNFYASTTTPGSPSTGDCWLDTST